MEAKVVTIILGEACVSVVSLETKERELERLKRLRPKYVSRAFQWVTA